MSILLKFLLILCIFLSPGYLYPQEKEYKQVSEDFLNIWHKERYVKSFQYQQIKHSLITSLSDNTLDTKQRESILKALRRMEEDEQQIKKYQESKKRTLEKFEKMGLGGLLKPRGKAETEKLWEEMKKKEREKRTQESIEEKECLYTYEEIGDNCFRFKQKSYYVNEDRVKFKAWLDFVKFSTDITWVVLRLNISILQDITNYISSFGIWQIIEYIQKQQVENVKGACAIEFSNNSTKMFNVTVNEGEDTNGSLFINILIKSNDNFELLRKFDIKTITLSLGNGEILDSWETSKYNSAKIIDSMWQFYIK
ncbi:MAG: hypothetical protein IJ467_08230 [Bacteroidaceae bacterium]|nr:hypothetical protein [Bacteroidaceae bacterium]